MAEDNRTAQVRTSLIYTYGHFWMKAFPSAAPSDVSQFGNCPQRQQLFGVEQPGVSHYVRRLDTLVSPTALRRLQEVGERVAHRLFPRAQMPPRA
jgi:hypothetical protein